MKFHLLINAFAAFGLALSCLAEVRRVQELWLFLKDDLREEVALERTADRIRKAKVAGYTAVAFLCGRDYCGEWLELRSPVRDAAFVAQTSGPDRPHLMSTDRRTRYASVKGLCDELGLVFAPLLLSTGYCSMQASDPEMAAVFPVRNVPYVARSGKAVFAGGKRQRLGASETVVRPVAADGGLSRTTLDGMALLTPERRYRVTLRVRSEELSSQARELQGMKLVLHPAADRTRDLYLRPLPLKPTQGWTEVTGHFNSEDVDAVVASVGVWGDDKGEARFADVVIEEVGLQAPVCREGASVVVRDAASGRVYEPGRDYLPPPHLKALTIDGPAESLSLEIPSGSAIADGTRLSVDAYEPAAEYALQFSACLSHSGLRGYFQASAAEVSAWLAPKAWFLSADEFRVECRCALCAARGEDMAHKFAAAMRWQRDAIRRVAPEAEILFWSDMVDENHNARDRFCKCVTTFRGAADLLPKDLVAVPWWAAKAEVSCRFLGGKGFAVMPGAYYDKRTSQEMAADARAWLKALKQTPRARGIMYTSWFDSYRLMDGFAAIVREEWR